MTRQRETFSASMKCVAALIVALAGVAADFRVKFDVETTKGEGSFIIKVHEDWAPVCLHLRFLRDPFHSSHVQTLVCVCTDRSRPLQGARARKILR